jgi:uncharacterized protein YndB with AHSA1/START domain
VGARHVDVFRHADAPVEVVWSLLADHGRYNEWCRFPLSVLEIEGDDDPNGVGAVRVLGMPPAVTRERVLEFDPPHHLAYNLESGMPVSGYRADVSLEPTGDGGTDIRWRSSFESAPPGLGGPIRAMFHRVLTDTAKRLATRAEDLNRAG